MFSFITQPLLDALLWLNQLTGNLGLAIIVLTLALRLVLMPLTLKSLKAAGKMRDLQPKLNKLKKEHKDDKEKLQKAQMELFQEHGVNPAAGCLPQIFQLAIFIALYRVFIDFLQNGGSAIENPFFLGVNLTQEPATLLLPLLAAAAQLVLGLMLNPATDTAAEKTLAATTKSSEDDEEAGDMSQMAQTLQQQMVLVMPVAIGLFSTQVPAGLVIYWVISTLFSIVQQYAVSGIGGLTRVLQYVPGYTNK